MGAAIMFTAIRREHTSYNYVTLALFTLTTIVHVAMTLSAENIVLYVLTTILMSSIIAVVIVSQPHFILAPILEYAPILIAFMLCIIEDYSHLHLRAPCLLPWWTRAIDQELLSLSTSSAITHRSSMSFHDSTSSDYKIDDKSSMYTKDSILLKYMWSPSQSRAPSSRLSDISLSSSWPESPPSSWGTLTRSWFPDFSTQRQNFREQSHVGCQRARTV